MPLRKETQNFPEIRELGVIGNRRTAAIIARDGTVVWYCPGRFDRPSLFGVLLEPAAGSWRLELPGASAVRRRYLDESAVLETHVQTTNGEWIVTDWMPMGKGVPTGLLCRRFSPVPVAMQSFLTPQPDYGRTSARLKSTGTAATIGNSHYLYASHPLEIQAGTVVYTLPKGQEGWLVLSDQPLPVPTAEQLEHWLQATLARWRELASRTAYTGPYERAVQDSLRALRLLTFEDNGGIIAAPTLGLPEVLGGNRNYDYRYVWLRDVAMIVSALTRAGGRPCGTFGTMWPANALPRKAPMPLWPGVRQLMYRLP